jgi:chemotaxis protein histidine kinase CheA
MPADETEDNIEKNSYKHQIEEKLERARSRYNFFRCERTLFTVLTIGLTVAFATLIVRKFVNIPPYTYITLISLFSIYFLVSMATVFYRWMGKSDAASILDKKMGFKERLVTGLEYAEQNEDNKLFGLLVDDIENKLDDDSIKHALPHKFPGSTKFLVAVSVLFLILLFLPYMYPEKSDQIVSNIEETVVEAPDVIEDTAEESPGKDVDEKMDAVAEKEDKLKQEGEEAKEPQGGQEDKKLAEAKTEEPDNKQEKQEKKGESQLQAKTPEDKTKEEQLSKSVEKEQQKQKTTNPLQDQISNLLSNINSKLDQLEGKPGQEDKDEGEKSELADGEKQESQEKEDKSKQLAGGEKEQPEDKKEESGETTEASGSDQEPKLADKEKPESQEREDESKQLASAENEQLENKKEEPAESKDTSDTEEEPPEEKQAENQKKEQKRKKSSKFRNQKYCKSSQSSYSLQKTMTVLLCQVSPWVDQRKIRLIHQRTDQARANKQSLLLQMILPEHLSKNNSRKSRVRGLHKLINLRLHLPVQIKRILRKPNNEIPAKILMIKQHKDSSNRQGILLRPEKQIASQQIVLNKQPNKRVRAVREIRKNR